MILFLMVGWLVGMATGDVNMSPVVVLDHCRGPWRSPGGPRGSLGGLEAPPGRSWEVPGGPWAVPGRSSGGPWASPGIPWEAPGGPWGVAGRPWALPETPTAPLGTSLGASVGAMSTLKNIEKPLFLYYFQVQGRLD